MEFGIYHLSLIETAMPRSEMTTRCLFSTVNLRKFLAFPTVVEVTPRVSGAGPGRPVVAADEFSERG